MSPGSGAAALPATEELLDRLCRSQNGEYYTLVKLKGSGVPEDLELLFCKNKFAVLQVRVKNLVCGVVHEYATSAGDIRLTGGVYELKCKRCAHELQVKVQPALGLLDLLKPPPYNTVQEVDAILRRLEAISALFYLLLAFQRDPTREEAPLGSSASGATRCVNRLTTHPEVLDFVLDKCPVFTKVGEAKSPRIRLADPSRPKSRGLLLKALLEVKMLLVIAVEHFQADESQFLTPQQLQDFHNFLIEIHEDSLAGGAAAQYRNVNETWDLLKALVVGPSISPAAAAEAASASDAAAAAAAAAAEALLPEVDGGEKLTVAEAWKVLQSCVTNVKHSVLPRLQQRGQQISDLELPSTDFTSAAGGAHFKTRYCRIWRRAIDAYLFDLVHSNQYAKGPVQGLAMIRGQWSRPDRALQLTCPSVDLDKAIASNNAEFEAFLVEKAAKRKDGASVNFNPRNSTGLINPGENLCASNALLQLLFSAEPLRVAVLQAPDLASNSGASSADGAGSSSSATAPVAVPAASAGPSAPSGGPMSLEGEARQLVAGLRRLFTDMDRPERALTSARDVAAALYGKELGQQQDCDELMHRLSLLLQEGLGSVEGKPFEALRKEFQRLFVGATSEARLKAENADGFQPVCPTGEGTKPKEFLTIPLQEGNASVTQALEDFTSWSSTGGSEVAWTQERLRTVPPFLCFASRQVSALEWEESLNLTRFVAAPSASMQRRLFERSRAQQLEAELKEALQHLQPASRSLAKASTLVHSGALSTQAEQLARALKEVEVQLPPASRRIAELDGEIGDGFDEPPLEAFVEGVPEAAGALAAFRDRLSASTVKALADAALAAEGAEGGSEEWKRLVEDRALPAAAAEAILAKLRRRRDEHSVHMFDVHAIIVYQGLGQFGHYVAFIRQADGHFLCFDDEQVTELADAAAVRTEIAGRGGQGYPATVRMVTYRRRSASAGGAAGAGEGGGGRGSEPLEVSLPGLNGSSNGANRADVDSGENDAKRRRTA